MRRRIKKTRAYRSFSGAENVLRTRAAEAREQAFEEVIRSIPAGKVVTYGQVAEAAGYPRAHRLVARFLGATYFDDIPWQRVVGAGGEIKIRGKGASRQRSLLKAEGVTFAGLRIDMERFGHAFY
jgi:methylated-DNA-protein-cysteine methyltransferase-like protein